MDDSDVAQRKPLSERTRTSRRKLVAWSIVGAVIVALVIVGTVSKNGSGSTDNGKTDAASFIGKINQNAQAASVDGTALLSELEDVSTKGDISGLYQVASDAKALHDHLKDWRGTLLGQVNASDGDQMEFVDAENEIKNSAGTIQSWAGNPNPSKTADLTSQLATAVRDWNASVQTIWTKAGRVDPPTIGLGQ